MDPANFKFDKLRHEQLFPDIFSLSVRGTRTLDLGMMRQVFYHCATASSLNCHAFFRFHTFLPAVVAQW
jgi:hypothetical protein